jgi:hypothetical protein
MVITSSSSSLVLATRETAGLDTFVLYGGPDHPTEGKFQMVDGVTADWGGGNGLPGGGYGGGPNAWIPVDLRDQPVYWHVDTFAAENLNSNGPGNRAMWSGVAAGDPLSATWSNSPGYGNDWNDRLLYESAAVPDPSVGETVTLDFFFNHDVEPGYDYFVVEYDSAGRWTEVYAIDGDNADTLGVLQPPGVQYSTVGANPIVFVGNDFGGDYGDQIRIRLSVYSDGAWSDQDGLWPTSTGAAQVDDISVSNSVETLTETFEGPGPYKFNPDKSPFAGDYADVYPRFSDVDPCRDNLTPLIGFMDTGQIIRNGPGLGGDVTTGGSTSAGIDYGIVGNWVINYTGGLSFGVTRLTNEIWSPPIAWDLPGTDDNGVDIAGAKIRFTIWTHLPLINGIFYLWHVRSHAPGEVFDNWTDRNFVYHGGPLPVWGNIGHDVSDLMEAGPEFVQMALACWDYADVFGFPGDRATPSPVFDNAAFYKYRISGPTFATRTIDLAQDGFPINGSIDTSTQASRDALDIPFNMARDINSGDLINSPGDSVIIDVASVIPDAAVTDIRMVWALSTNVVFEDAIRTAPARAKDENVVAGAAGTVWTGEAVADTSTTSRGAIIADRFFVDLPDVDFMYPGDVLHYYVQGVDSDGRTSTLPADTSGFGIFGPAAATYDRTFTVRCLPTITDTAGAQPDVLVLNDFGRRGGENEFTTSFQQLGYGEGVDFDTYTTQGPSSGVSNSIGSSGAHGAEAGQLGGYHHIFYFGGNLSQILLTGGTNWGVNVKANDIDVLEQWHALDPGTGSRNIVYFGDYIAIALANDSSEALGYLRETMGVDVIDHDVRDVIGGQTAPVVSPSGDYGQFLTDFVTYGGCLTTNEFDQIQPLVGAGVGHYFSDTSGVPITDVSAGVASVVNPGTYGVDITFPYSMMYIYDITARAPVDLSTRTLLFAEILSMFGASGGTSGEVSAPAVRSAELSIFPNPFNPSTLVRFSNTYEMTGFVKVYNLRGELVRTLHTGEFTQVGGFSETWDGTDNRGATVASGVYLIKANADGQVRTAKAALVK